MKQKKLLCEVHPVFYHLSVWEKRMKVYLRWYFGSYKYCREKGSDLPVKVVRHQSLLMRKLGNTDMQLQRNKVKNLFIAVPKVNGIIIKPGETFSFCKVLGNATKRKGYVEGLLLSKGEVKVGFGGGLCQLSNLIYWMVLHTPLTVIERHHHSFDPFPDENRTLPFGSGATVFYNYGDLQFRNDTPYTFQLKVWLTDELIKGEILCSQELPHSYHVFEKDHAFIKKEGRFYRKNTIWRDVIDRQTGNTVREEYITGNFAEVKYELDENYVVEETV